MKDFIKGLVSIAIPAYKKTFLNEAIESALQQTYSNIELIIVNDKSPYDLDEIVKEYSDSRVRYYKNDVNIGGKSIVYNWNRCLEYAKGEFFVLLCDDDLLMPSFVEKLLSLAYKFPACSVFHARRNVGDEQTGVNEMGTIWPEFESYSDFVKNKYDGKREHTITEFMYRTEDLKKFGYKVYPKGWCSDGASVVMMTRLGGIASSLEPLAVFRKSTEHISHGGYGEFDKARATLMYRSFLLSIGEDILPTTNVDNLIQHLLLGHWHYLNLWEKLYILWKTPWGIFSLRAKIALLGGA